MNVPLKFPADEALLLHFQRGIEVVLASDHDELLGRYHRQQSDFHALRKDYDAVTAKLEAANANYHILKSHLDIQNRHLSDASLQINALTARCEALERDAARYRWLRAPAGEEGKGPGRERYSRVCLVCTEEGEELDAIIDKRLAAADGAQHE